MTQIHPSTEPQAERRAQSEPVMTFLDMRGNAELADGLRPSIESDADAVPPQSPISLYPDSAINCDGGQERTVHQLLIEYRWPTLATGFLSQIPQNDGDWENRNFSSDLVNDVSNMFHLNYLPPWFCPKTDWPRFFTAAVIQLAGLKSNPSVASLFSIVLVATCHIAIIEGCSMDVVNTTLRTCLILRGIPQANITPHDLVDLRLGVLNGIDLLDECVSALGPRANEFPLYSLVFQLLGGQGSSWDYDEISGILRFNGQACPLCEVPEPACCDNLEDLMAEYPERRRGYAPPMAPRVRPQRLGVAWMDPDGDCSEMNGGRK
ncbi:hypothetical protein QQX98_003371 [Neonectria punicea]|uniref:Transcription factor domain-containing protein n=1 Tax=Neonectria punicea TaxID=979145 RepID=A0ABR1HF01_9HYPO